MVLIPPMTLFVWLSQVRTAYSTLYTAEEGCSLPPLDEDRSDFANILTIHKVNLCFARESFMLIVAPQNIL